MPEFRTFSIEGAPPPWTVADVDKFVVAALNRIAEAGGTLPARFHLSVCPWGERNALGGTPPQVQEVMDPRLRLVHFTGCGRPYLVAAFIGAGAAARQEVAMRHLPWSEHFAVTHEDGHASLVYLDCTEDLWDEDGEPRQRTLQELLRQGGLADF